MADVATNLLTDDEKEDVRKFLRSRHEYFGAKAFLTYARQVNGGPEHIPPVDFNIFSIFLQSAWEIARTVRASTLARIHEGLPIAFQKFVLGLEQAFQALRSEQGDDLWGMKLIEQWEAWDKAHMAGYNVPSGVTYMPLDHKGDASTN